MSSSTKNINSTVTNTAAASTSSSSSMDFLSLFPAESQQCPLLFTAYRQMGLLCWSAGQPNQLVLISALTNSTSSTTSSSSTEHQQQQPTQNVLFKRVTSISLWPELPQCNNANASSFERLLVNASGSLVALVGPQMVFIVEMDPQFWDRRHILGLDFDSTVEHLAEQYFARCDLVHLGLFMRKYPPRVLKAAWWEAQEDAKELFRRVETTHRHGLLGLLFSDNVIRLYELPAVVDRPWAQLDFNSLLPDRTPPGGGAESGDDFGGTESGGNSNSRPHSTFGFVTRLVSFDFGPVHLAHSQEANKFKQYSGKQQQQLFGSLLAMDSNGEVYVGLFPFTQCGQGDVPMPSSPQLAGPLPCHFPPVQPSIASRLLCAGLELHCVRHGHSQLLSMWALGSEDGLLVHLLLAQQQQSGAQTQNFSDVFGLGQQPSGLPIGRPGTSSSPNWMPQLELFALECLEIAEQQQQQKPGMARMFGQQKMQMGMGQAQAGSSAKAVRLENDGSSSLSCPSYLAVCATDVYRLDLSPLMAQLVSNSSSKSGTLASQQMGQSVVQQLIMFARGQNQPAAAISSLASLELFGNSSSAGASAEWEQPQQQPHLLAALCTGQGELKAGRKRHTFMATLINSSISPSSSSQLDSLLSPQKKQQKQSVNQQPSLAEEVRRLLVVQHGIATLPSVKFPEEEEEGGDERQKLAQRAEQLSLVQNAVQDILLGRAMPQRHRAIDYAVQRSAQMLAAFETVEHLRAGFERRLNAIFQQVTQLRNQIAKRQHRVQQTEERIRKIALALQPLMFPGAEEEPEVVENLHKMHQRLVECRREIKKLDQRLCEHRQGLFGPSGSGRGGSSRVGQLISPFAECSSATTTWDLMPAQVFALSKNGRECAKLREKLQQLERQINGHKSEEQEWTLP